MGAFEVHGVGMGDCAFVTGARRMNRSLAWAIVRVKFGGSICT